MQHLNTLIQVVNAASQVADLARSSQVYRFGVAGDSTTFYMHAAHAEVRIFRWFQPQIEVVAQLQAPFAWRVVSDQDDAGVYFVARRRPLVGELAGGTFIVTAPPYAHIILKLENAALRLDGVSGTIEVPPISSGVQSMIVRGEARGMRREE